MDCHNRGRTGRQTRKRHNTKNPHLHKHGGIPNQHTRPKKRKRRKPNRIRSHEPAKPSTGRAPRGSRRPSQRTAGSRVATRRKPTKKRTGRGSNRRSRRSTNRKCKTGHNHTTPVAPNTRPQHTHRRWTEEKTGSGKTPQQGANQKLAEKTKKRYKKKQN